jgi:uroporphyrinogen-III decarboxylase
VISQNRIDQLKKLQEQVRHIADSHENKEKEKIWAPQAAHARDHWRGMPKRIDESGRVPYTIEPENAMWFDILSYDARDYYTKPDVYLECQLRMSLFRNKYFDDDTVIGKNIPIWLGVPFEPSFFGIEVVFVPDEDPWIGKNPVIHSENDLDRLEYPDFFKSGLMPKAHEMYSAIKELLDDDYSVTFPEWGRSPFAVSLHLRGMGNIVMDMIENPEFVHKLMKFMNESRKRWTTERFKFLGYPVEKGNLYNDEVNCPLLSPSLYKEFILPYEQEMSYFHHGIAYWHSCGITTPLLNLIKQIDGLDMFHVGPWTDFAEANKVFGKTTALEYCQNPISDIYSASEDDIRKKLIYVLNSGKGNAYTIRADGLQKRYSLEDDLKKIFDWMKVAKSILNNEKLVLGEVR